MDLKSTDQKTMQAAFERLALSRPLPAYADLVVTETQNAVKRSRDKFAMAMAFEIKRNWNEAKQAAETLQAAKRSGGFRYLEQVIAGGSELQAGVAILAVAYSGNPRAGIVVGQYWRKAKIPGLRALLIVGPPAADTLVKQLGDDDYFVVKNVIEVLGKIGKEDHIPASKKTFADSKPILRRSIEESVRKIEARSTAEAKKGDSGTKKKK
ncbi:MAG: hypothetical protein ACI92S_002950 [Planctomycetaceae bacterium]